MTFSLLKTYIENAYEEGKQLTALPAINLTLI